MATNGLLIVDKEYPARIKDFLFLALSDNQPEKSLSILAVDSAIPSIIPMKAGPAPRTVVKKTGRRGYIISLLTSVRKLTKPSINIFLVIPLSKILESHSPFHWQV